MNRRQLNTRDYTIGWICALPIELAAAQEMLDEEYERPFQDDQDPNLYTVGRVDVHNVVVACLPAGNTGTQSAATVAARMRSKFTSIRVGLMVGIGGGVPTPESDIRLGDVVISQPHLGHGGVVQYDFGKTGAGGSISRTGWLNAPPLVLLHAVVEQRARYFRGRSDLSEYLSTFDRLGTFSHDMAGPDILFQASYSHVGGATCKECSKEMEVKRHMREEQEAAIHYGTIASGNQVMKDGITRDRISKELDGVLCFEMEAAGLMNDFPCLVIRGICDYADSHKTKKWQPYAAATAAACAKEILSLIPAAAAAKAERRGQSFQETLQHSAGNTGQRRIELKLDELLKEVRLGFKSPALFALAKNLEKELVDDNITEVDIEHNKDFIDEWMKSNHDKRELQDLVERHLEKERSYSAINKSEYPQNTSTVASLDGSASPERYQAYCTDDDEDEVSSEDSIPDDDRDDDHFASETRGLNEGTSHETAVPSIEATRDRLISDQQASRVESRSSEQSAFDTKESSERSYTPRVQPSKRREYSDRERTRTPVPEEPRRQPSLSPPPRLHAKFADNHYYSPDSRSREYLNTGPGAHYDLPPYSNSQWNYPGVPHPHAANYRNNYAPPPTQPGYDHATDNTHNVSSANPFEPETFDHATGQAGPFSFNSPEAIFTQFWRGEKEIREPALGNPLVTVVEKPLPVTLEDSFNGVTKNMMIKRKRYNPSTGLTSIEPRILQVPIKRGLKPGSKIKFSGVGNDIEGGTQDLHLIVEDKPHPVFKRVNDDIHTTLDIDLLESLCGWRQVVRTIDGKHIAVSHPGPTPHTWEERFPGLGMPLSKNPDQRGDFFIKVIIHQPKNLTSSQKEAVKKAWREIKDYKD